MSDMLLSRMEELVALLNDYATAYYAYSSPKVSDAEYDQLYDELLSLEKITGVVLAASPTHRVGSEPLSKFEKQSHLERLWSLDKVKTESELKAWAMRAEKLRLEYNESHENTLPPLSYVLEYKFDGLTINLTYEKGVLTKAATRGDGSVGEAILPHAKTIKTIPCSIDYKGLIEIQGECYMRLGVLDELNKSGEEQFKNARNAAAGALRNLDPQITARRKLDCFLYNVGYHHGIEFKDQMDMLSFLKSNGFPVNDFAKRFENIDDLLKSIHDAENTRSTLDYLIDGMVIKISDYKTRLALGYTDKFPRWAVAYKFVAEETTTIVKNITWEVGRTGKLTPRAHLEPVELAGATISFATLNNWDDINRKRIGIGSKVFIRRSNDVIPEILSAVEGDVPQKKAEKPVVCPACGAGVEHRGVHLFCTNSLSCPPQIAARLAHYASRDAMNISTFSEKTATLLVGEFGLKSIPDMYDLTLDNYLSLKGFKGRKAQNLLIAIEQSKNCTLGAFLYAIGIPNVGSKTATDIAKHFKTLENVRCATADELVKIDEVGTVIAESIVTFFADKAISNQIDRLLAHGVLPEDETFGVATNSLIAEKTFVVTGTMERMGRTEMERLIESLGAKAASSVSKKTDYVIAGEGAGSKLKKANELNIKVLSETEFYTLIGEND